MEKLYEDIINRLVSITRRMVVAVIVLVVLLVINNMAWLYAWNQYEYVGEETSIITKDGVSNFIGNDGVIGDEDDE